MIPSVLGLIPFIYHGKNRVLAFGCIGAASGLSAFLPLFLGIVMQFGGFRVTFGALAVYFALVLLLSFKLPAIEKPAEKLKFDGWARASPPRACSCSSSASPASQPGASSSPSPSAPSPSSASPRPCPWPFSA